MKNHLGTFFFGIKDGPGFFNGIQSAISSLQNPAGIYTGDNLFVFNRGLNFLDDAPFLQSHARHSSDDLEKSILWRMAVVLWGFRNGLGLQGDFIECSCRRGTTARIICDTVGFKNDADRHYYLYDHFEYAPNLAPEAMEAHSKELHAEVRQRFSEFPNVTVTRGKVPGVLSDVAPKSIAFMHLDLDSAQAEIEALDMLFERMVPGAVLILNNYGWLAYRAIREAEDPWFEAKGYSVLELPTGQGLVVKR